MFECRVLLLFLFLLFWEVISCNYSMRIYLHPITFVCIYFRLSLYQLSVSIYLSGFPSSVCPCIHLPVCLCIEMINYLIIKLIESLFTLYRHCICLFVYVLCVV